MNFLRNPGWFVSLTVVAVSAFSAGPDIVPPADDRPDLTVQISGPASATAGEEIGPKVKVTATNMGNATAVGTLASPGEGYVIDVVLSRDQRVPPGFAIYSARFQEDALLKGGRISKTVHLVPASSKTYSTGALIPLDARPGKQPSAPSRYSRSRDRGANYQNVPTLTLDQPIERELATGEKHSYQLTLAANDYVRIVVKNRGPGLVAMLFDSAGNKVAESTDGIFSQAAVSLIAVTKGEFRLEVRAAAAADKTIATGSYEVMVAERRAAAPQDQDRVKAERIFEAGRQLYSQAIPEAYRAAVSKYEEALTLFRTVSDRLGEARALSSLGSVYWRVNDRRKSIACFEQALPLVRSLGERKAEAWSLCEIGFTLNSLGEKERALEYLKQALPLLRDVGERSREAFTVATIGSVYGELGDRQEAITWHQQALTLRRNLGDRHGEANSLASLGGSYEAMGEKQKALEYLHQALPLLHDLGEQQGEAQTLYVLGVTYDSLNERQKAVEYYSRALVLRKAAGSRGGEAMLRNQLANLYQGLGEHQQALTHYQQALALYEGQKDLNGVARMLRDIGLVYDGIGEKQKAAEYYKRALPLFRLGANREPHARLLANLGKILSEMGEHEEALANLNQALAILKKLNNQFFELYALYWISRTERDRGNLPEARARIEEALAKIEALRTSYYQPEVRATGFARAHDFYELEIDLLVRLGQPNPDKKNLERDFIAAALETSEQARARTMLDLLAEARIDIRQGISAELKKREQDSQTHISAIQSQLIQVQQHAKPDAGRVAALEGQLKQAYEERETLEREIRRQYPRYAEILYPTPLGADAIRALLDERTALLEYTLGQESSFLFVVTRESVRAFRLPGGDKIGRLVEVLRSALRQPGRRELGNYTHAAEQLYEMLIGPAAAIVASKQRLLIAPDGALHYLPFEALLVNGPGSEDKVALRSTDYLIKRWAISYVPSASVIGSLRQRTRPAADNTAKEFLAFADPVYRPGGQIESAGADKKPLLDQTGAPGAIDSQARWEPTRLAQSRFEATEIARLYRPEQVSLYLGADAKEENVKTNSALATARRIHFAAHGVLNERRPQYSGLVLTLDDDPSEDGLLQVYEIFDLKLNAELVVLSACDTGLGQELKGEGMIGLTRAFMYAGAPSVVVSLWQVADRSTAELMVKFYQRLDRASDKADALRQAKLDLMQNPLYAHPYYWAPFVLVGEVK